jgi:hypothetical protein
MTDLGTLGGAWSQAHRIARGLADDHHTRIVLVDFLHDPEGSDVGDEVSDAGKFGQVVNLLLAREVEANSVGLFHGRRDAHRSAN